MTVKADITVADSNEARIAVLESQMHDTRDDIKDVREDVDTILTRTNQLLVAIIVGAMALIGNGIILLVHK